MTGVNAETDADVKPAIVLSAEDYARLSTIAYATSRRLQNLADELAREIERARILDAGEQPSDTVHMNSQVEFRDETSGKVRKVTLVYPQDANVLEGKISILTPIGTALIGLHTGDSMGWRTADGKLRRLTVLSIGES